MCSGPLSLLGPKRNGVIRDAGYLFLFVGGIAGVEPAHSPAFPSIECLPLYAYVCWVSDYRRSHADNGIVARPPAVWNIERLHSLCNYTCLSLVDKRCAMRSMSAGRHT